MAYRPLSSGGHKLAALEYTVDEIYARRSRGGRVLCGRQDEDGQYTCDEPLADFVTPDGQAGSRARYLVALDGWALDRKKAIWHETTSVEDRRAAGIVLPRAMRETRRYPTLPALARCPKCRAVQWLEPERLGVAPGPNY